jgi:hypothetical protein
LNARDRRVVGAVSVAVVTAVIGGVLLYLSEAHHEPRLAAGAVHSAPPKAAGYQAAGATVSVRPITGKNLPRTRLLCVLAPGATSLPPSRLRGLAHHLRQYPDIALATPAQGAAAERLLAKLRTAALRWRNPREAAAAGFDMHTARRAAGDKTPHYLHAENRRFARDGRYLDSQRPEALIYANVPGHALVLIGVMFSMPRGIHGPTPAGPVARWHFHRVCARGNLRGLKPLGDGTCPRGETLREGSEMLHVWFTDDRRSAYAIHAPEPELCTAHLLPVGYCASGRYLRGM